MKAILRSVLVTLTTLVALSGAAFAQGVMPVPVQQFFDNSGNPLNGGKLCAYAATTTTPQNTYSDSALTSPNVNPVILDAYGRPLGGGVYLSATGYKFVLKTAGSDATCATGTTLWTQDNVYATAPANLLSITGKVTYSAATVLTLSSNAVVPTQNIHALDTSGGAQNLNTITTTNTSPGFVLYLTANNGGANPVTVKNGAGNLSLAGGDYVMNAATSWVSLVLKGTTWYELARAGTSQTTNNGLNTFRLTPSSGTCVPTTDVTAVTTIYWAPCGGNVIALYDGSTTWTVRTSSELSIAVPATTSTMYDVFVYDNAGTPALELTAWSSDTTRATALTPQNGVLVKSGATTRRFVGNIRTTTVSGQTESSLTKRFVMNYNNRVRLDLLKADATANWAYSLAVLRQVRGQAANQVEFIVGVADLLVSGSYTVTVTNDQASLQAHQIGLGLDSTTAFASNSQGQTVVTGPAGSTQISGTARADMRPAVGYHYLAMLEKGTGTITTSWFGTGTYTGSATLLAWIEG